MKRCFTGMTDVGQLRSVNQDAYYLDPEGRFFIVADGMGGHIGGAEASQMAIQVIQTFLCQHWQAEITDEDLLEQALLAANQAILADQTQHPERAEMGTTIVVTLFRDEQNPLYTHIGDSRLYRLRSNTLEQLTRDHTWVAQAMQSGEMTAQQAREHPMRHVLAQCLGRPNLGMVEIHPLDFQLHDRLLLCSDGLTEELSDQVITNHLALELPCNKVALRLVQEAKNHGGRDNITVVIVALEELEGTENLN